MNMARARGSLLLATVTLLASCGGSDSGTNPTVGNPPPAAQANDIYIVVGASTRGAGAFDPNPKTVALAGAASAVVRWVNLDTSTDGYSTVGVTHHIVSNDGTSFDTGNIEGNDAMSKTLAAGTYAYHCTIHPPMTGTLVITP